MITVFTPTYNRKKLLSRLKDSLENQTNQNFEWLIVDDGSCDATNDYINTIIKTSKLNIRYHYQQNAGKHIAFNKGLDLAKGDYFLCVDSDDYLVENAIEIIEDNVKKIDEKTIGLIFRMEYGDRNISSIWDTIDQKLLFPDETKERYGITETVLVTRTSVLKKYRFPIIRNKDGDIEKFSPEGLLYNQTVTDGPYKAINQIIYIGEYQNDGLTNNLFTKTWVENYNTVLVALSNRYNYSKRYSFSIRVKARFKTIMNINALCMELKLNIWEHTPSVFLSILLYVPSFLFGKVRFGK